MKERHTQVLDGAGSCTDSTRGGVSGGLCLLPSLVAPERVSPESLCVPVVQSFPQVVVGRWQIRCRRIPSAPRREERLEATEREKG